MLTKEVFVRGRSVYANGDVTLIRTSIGVYNMHVLFDAAEWLDFPVKVVFGYGAEQVTQTLVLTALTSEEWAAEATVEIPWEVMAQLGTVRVTFQGTDSTSGSEKHIITAMSGGLWSVAEEGDVTDGTVPTPAPTEDEWNQAFEAAMIAANDASSAAVAANNAAVSANTQAVRAEAAAEAAEGIVAGDIATTERAGIVKPDGTTITVEEDGTISSVSPLATPDWDEANSSANDFIKNRPFGRFAGTWATLYDQSGITLNTSEYLYPDNVKFGKVDGFTIDGSAIVGKSYSVTLDGTLTQCVAEVGTVEMVDESLPRGQTVTVSGAMLTGNNFVILLPCAEVSTETPKAFVKGVTTTHSLKVAGSKVVLHTVPRQYLPVATSSAIGAVKVDNSTIEADANGSIGVKAVPAGKLTGTISADNLPSYVDDVEEYATSADFPATGETGKIYVALDSNASYRWGGSAYVRVASGENATTTTDGLMSHTDKAKLDAAPGSYGDGLSLSSYTLNLGPLTKSAQGASVETDGCAIFAVTGEGWAEQQVTTGKNLLEPNSGVATQISNGAIIKGSVGDSTPFQPVELAAGTYMLKVTLLSVPSTDRTFQVFKDTTSSTAIFNFAHLNGKSAGDSAEATITLAESTTLLFRLWGAASTDFAIQAQLESGSQATSFEPYTGGQPAPSPDFPQEIRVCRGRNLVDPANVTVLNAYVYNGEIISNSDNRTLVLPVEPLTAYTLIGRHVKISSTVDDWNLAEFTSEPSIGSVGTKINWSVIESDDINFTFVTKATTRYIAVKFANTTRTDAASTLPAIQISKGACATFVPFGHLGIEVQSRNLFDSSTVIGGYIDANGNIQSHGAWKASAYIDVRNFATVTASGGSTDTVTKFGWYKEDLSTLSVTATADGTYTVPSGAAYMRCSVHNTKTGTFMLEPGSTAHAYEPYSHATAAVPLPSKGFTGAAGDFADALSIDSAGRWEWDVETAETVLNGTESWAVGGDYASTGGGFWMSSSALPGGKNVNPYQTALCDKLISLPGRTAAADCTGYIGYWNSCATIRVRPFDVTGQMTVSQLTDWLASNNLTFLYPLATPTTESGYINLPDLPAGATVSIPELESIGVSWFVAGTEAAVEHGNNVLRRAQQENEEIENAIADLATRVAALES